MRQNTETEAQSVIEKKPIVNWDEFFAVWLTSAKYEKLLVMQMKPHPRIWFKNVEVEYKDIIEFFESLEIKTQSL